MLQLGWKSRSLSRSPRSLGAGVAVFLILTAFLSPRTANAQSIEYQLNTPFSGDPNPTPSGPWVDAIFTDGTTPGTVLLTITNIDLAPGQFIDDSGNGGTFFNLDPNSDVSSLHFSYVSSTDTSGNEFDWSVQTSSSGFKADGTGGDFDINILFNETGAFTNDSSITLKITSTSISDLVVTNFEATSTAGYYAAAKIMGLSGGGGSSYIEPNGGVDILPVPEPSPSAIVAAGMGVLSCARLWLRRSKK